MIVNLGTIDNYETLPTPVLDESLPEGYRMEPRLQVALKMASDEHQVTVEFRLGEGSDAPSEQQLNTWLKSGELVQTFCTGLAARPFVHREGKTYRTRGNEVQIGDTKAALDAFVVFAGFAMSPLGDGALSIEDAVRKARAAYKRGQRAYRERRSAERIKQLQERKAAQDAEKQAQAAEEATGQNGRKRSYIPSRLALATAGHDTRAAIRIQPSCRPKSWIPMVIQPVVVSADHDHTCLSCKRYASQRNTGRAPSPAPVLPSSTDCEDSFMTQDDNRPYMPRTHQPRVQHSAVRGPRLRPWFQRPSVDPVEHAMRELERQGAGMARLAHLFATLMVVLFSLGSLVALSGDAFGAIVAAIEHGGLPGIPQAISVLVSTLMVVCCDIGLVYAAMTLRVLKTRGTSRDEQLLHWFVLVAVAAIEAGTYLYMSAHYESPVGIAWAIVVARALMAPLLSVYLSMARPHPVTPRDILHQAELAQGIQLVRDVLRVAQDPGASLADKMRLYGASAHMAEQDRQRLEGMIAVVQDRLAPVAPKADTPAIVDGVAVIESQPPRYDEAARREVDDQDQEEFDPMPMQRYSARRLTERIEATR